MSVLFAGVLSGALVSLSETASFDVLSGVLVLSACSAPLTACADSLSGTAVLSSALSTGIWFTLAALSGTDTSPAAKAGLHMQEKHSTPAISALSVLRCI